jgi:hypothetical protein
LKIVIVFWIQKLKRDVLSFVLKKDLPLVHLEHKHVKKSATLLSIPPSDSKSLQIKYVRIVESFPKKPELPLRLLEAIRLCEEYPQINFLLGSCFASPNYAPLFDQFDKIISECTQMVVARRREGYGQEASPETATTLSPSVRARQPVINDPVTDIDGPKKRIVKKRSIKEDVSAVGFRKSLRLANKRRGKEPSSERPLQRIPPLLLQPAPCQTPPLTVPPTIPSPAPCDSCAVANSEVRPGGVNPAWRQILFRKLASLRASEGCQD